MKIYFIVTIDTECDKSRDWSVPQPLQFRNIMEGIPNRLMPLFEKYGVKPTYLLSPEVIRNPACSALLKNLKNVELGTHLHGEFVEPNANYATTGTWDFQADYDYDTEFQKLENLTKLFIETFGYQPVSFRAGRFGIGKNTLSILYDLGYKVDSSMFPYSVIRTRQHMNSFFYYPVKAYFPDFSTYNQSDIEKRVLHVPMTVHNRFFQHLPRTIGLPLSRHSFVRKIATKILGRPLTKTFSLRPSNNSFEQMKALSINHIRLHKEDEPVFLNMMFHSNEMIEGASPYPQTTFEIECMLDRMAKYCEFAKQQAMSITLSESLDVCLGN